MLQYSDILKSAQNTVATTKQCSGNHPQHSCFVGRVRAMLNASAFTIFSFFLLIFVVKYFLCPTQTPILWNNVTLCQTCHPGNLHHSILHYIWISPTGESFSPCLSVCLHLNLYFFLLSQTQIIFVHFVPLLLNLCMLRTDVSEPCTDWCWLNDDIWPCEKTPVCLLERNLYEVHILICFNLTQSISIYSLANDWTAKKKLWTCDYTLYWIYSTVNGTLGDSSSVQLSLRRISL